MKKTLGTVALGTALSMSLISCESKSSNSNVKWEQVVRNTRLCL